MEVKTIKILGISAVENEMKEGVKKFPDLVIINLRDYDSDSAKGIALDGAKEFAKYNKCFPVLFEFWFADNTKFILKKGVCDGDTVLPVWGKIK